MKLLKYWLTASQSINFKTLCHSPRRKNKRKLIKREKFQIESFAIYAFIYVHLDITHEVCQMHTDYRIKLNSGEKRPFRFISGKHLALESPFFSLETNHIEKFWIAFISVVF